MKGLLTKEFIHIRENSLTYIVAIIAACVAMAFLKVSGFIIGWLFLSGASWAFMGADVSCGWNRYATALPISRREIVKSKYMHMLFRELVLVIALALLLVLRIILRRSTGIFMEIADLLVYLSMFSAFASIEMLLILKFGVNRGSYRTVLVIAMVAVILLAVEKFMGFSVSLNDADFIKFSFVFFISAIIFRIISFHLGVRAYEKRDL